MAKKWHFYTAVTQPQETAGPHEIGLATNKQSVTKKAFPKRSKLTSTQKVASSDVHHPAI